jgi:hypothetical protein
MSVLVTLTLDGDGEKLERFAAENPDRIKAIRDHAVDHGLIAHRFYASEGQIMVIDEWPDAESFRSFFGHAEGAIGEMMGAVGVTGRPEPKFWRELESHDAYGWDA